MPVAHPAQLGKYRIIGMIGQGAMGVVYKGFDPHIQRTLAIKTVRNDLLQGSEDGASTSARFLNEAQAAGRLNHPGIVAVYEYGEAESCAYIAMEYVEGATLRQYMQRGAVLRQPDVLSLVTQLLDALDYAHEGGVLHRDIKPANLVITREGKLKVADFGIARVESIALTRTNLMIGSPGYMAPEQYAGTEIDRRVDLYSSAVVLYELMTGRLPFEGNEQAIMYKTVYELPKRPLEAGADPIWEPFESIVLRGLEKSPDTRWPTARQFRQALLDASTVPVQDALDQHTVMKPIVRHGIDPTLGAEHRPSMPPRSSPGGSMRGSSLPPASLPGTGTPGTASPGTALPGTATPGTASPAFSMPGASMPGASMPGASMPGASMPGASMPGVYVSGTALPTGPFVPGTPMTTMSWDRSTLTRVEQDLARHVGPLAKVLVQRAAAGCADVSTLRSKLAAHIDSEPARVSFLNGHAAVPTRQTPRLDTGGTPSSKLHASRPGTGTSAALTPEVIERTAKVMIRLIGPVAAVLVKRAAARSTSADQFHEALVAETVGVDREKLLQALRDTL